MRSTQKMDFKDLLDNGSRGENFARTDWEPQKDDCLPGAMTEDEYLILNSHLEKEAKRLPVKYRCYQKHRRLVMIQKIDLIVEDWKSTLENRFLAIYMMDLFMDRIFIPRHFLKLSAVCCLVVAIKLDENAKEIPGIDHLETVFDKEYSLDEMVYMENCIRAVVGFQSAPTTVACFVNLYFKKIVDQDDYKRFVNDHQNRRSDCFNEEGGRGISYAMFVDETLTHLKDVVKMIPFEIEFGNVPPSILAAAIICYVRRLQFVKPLWPERMANVTCYDYEDIHLLVDKIENHYHNSKDNTFIEGSDSGYLSQHENFCSVGTMFDICLEEHIENNVSRIIPPRTIEELITDEEDDFMPDLNDDWKKTLTSIDTLISSSNMSFSNNNLDEGFVGFTPNNENEMDLYNSDAFYKVFNTLDEDVEIIDCGNNSNDKETYDISANTNKTEDHNRKSPRLFDENLYVNIFPNDQGERNTE